jgi:hypothetical protein
MNNYKFSLLFLASSLLLVACGDDSKPTGGTKISKSTDLPLGIYEVVSFTENTEGCNEPGPQITDSPEFFVSTKRTWGSYTWLEFYSCNDIPDCEDKQQMLENEEFFGSTHHYQFDTKTSDGFSDEIASVSSQTDDDGMCINSKRMDNQAIVDSETILIEVRHYLATPFAPDASGYCMSDKVEGATKGAECAILENLELHLIQEL